MTGEDHSEPLGDVNFLSSTQQKKHQCNEKLIPFYQHLVDGYSIQFREEWTVKVEETDIDTTQVKEEPQDDNLVEPPTFQVNNSANQFKVILGSYKIHIHSNNQNTSQSRACS